jgi:hypothetical protein
VVPGIEDCIVSVEWGKVGQVRWRRNQNFGSESGGHVDFGCTSYLYPSIHYGRDKDSKEEGRRLRRDLGIEKGRRESQNNREES